jgi:hypothetical protein
VSGDSDFSPLVSKLRENNKQVIGLGVKNSSSDLLIDNCDEFIFYDDLVRDKRRHKGPNKADKPRVDKPKPAPASADATGKQAAVPATDAASAPRGPDGSGGSKLEAIEHVLETIEGLFRDRDGNVWGSMVKQTLKRKRPMFNETYYGYPSFNQLLEDAEQRGLLKLQKDPKSGGYIVAGFGPEA